MRIALVYPRLLSQFKSNLFPLGIVYIATLLRQRHYEVRLFDSSWDKDLSSLKRQLRDYHPDAVGISVTSDLIANARQVSDFSKGMGCTTIMGGSHPSALPRQTLEDIPSLDCIVIGEGELATLSLLEAIKSNKPLSGIKGIAYRKGNKICQRPGLTLCDIDKLPLPDRSLIPNYSRYLQSGIIGIIFVRGCPYNCGFCQPAEKAMFGGRIRFRSPIKIAEEIAYLYHRYKVREFYISNDLFIMNKPWIRQICAQLRARALLGKVEFIALARVDLFDEEMALLLNEMNVTRLLFGVESGSQKILDEFGKGINPALARQAFSLAKKHRIKTHALIIIGSPSETEETLQQTKKLIAELDPTQLVLSLFSALPNTHLHARYERNGLLSTRSPEQYDYYSFSRYGPNVRLQHLPYSRILSFRDELIRQRRPKVLLDNALTLIVTTLRSGSLSQAHSRWKTYLRCHDFFG
jgi:anaerobic magnesium-protoporphyrin IX monomethyl ester cyclase